MPEDTPVVKKSDIIATAILEGFLIEFDYQSSKDPKPTKRIVNGWLLANRKNTDYLIGHQNEGGTGYAIRTYKLDTIENLKITDKKMDHLPEKAADPKKWDTILAEAKII